MPSSRFHEISADRLDEFVRKGYKERHFFPHRAYRLPKCGPDAFRLAKGMRGAPDPEQVWEIILFADSGLTGDLPNELFFDDDLLWHQQQFGRVGQVATVNVVVEGTDAFTSAHQSDLVQRISRRRQYKTRIETRFKGWNQMLLNALLDFAVERGVERVHTPTADLALVHTDPKRDPGRALFDRIYDADVERLFSARRNGSWWTIDVRENQERIVPAEPKTESLGRERTIAVCHDLEAGAGYREVDPSFARAADERASANLDSMLSVESDAGVQATYCVVGALLDGVRAKIEDAAHCVAFHSYDHRLDVDGQLSRCRRVDYRLKGYRPPQSRLTPELSAENLCFHNFEWLASSVRSLGSTDPELRSRLVTIPIHIDDHPLYTRALSYDEWEQNVLDLVERHEFVAVSLHDCHAPLWLSRYRQLLERLATLGRLRTLDEVSSHMLLANAA